jgi:GGDEF domain-containing protein
MAERLRTGLPHGAGCAIGVAAWQADDDPERLTRRADRALYADKTRVTDFAHGARPRLHPVAPC